MSRPVQPLGTYGSISVRKAGPAYAATTRYRDPDGGYFRVQASGTTEMKAKIAERAGTTGDSDLDGNISLTGLARYWLEETRVSGRQAPQTLDAYERNLETVVLPALGKLRLRELTVGRVDRFLKALAPDHPSRARRAKIVLALVFDLAVRHDAAPKNPVRDAAPVLGAGKTSGVSTGPSLPAGAKESRRGAPVRTCTAPSPTGNSARSSTRSSASATST